MSAARRLADVRSDEVEVVEDLARDSTSKLLLGAAGVLRIGDSSVEREGGERDRGLLTPRDRGPVKLMSRLNK